tara:strand:+ start:21488 stop:22519 length:1032 start_codon:yes stop_codon:yes gene_type:complete
MALLATLASMSSLVSGIGPAFQMIGNIAGEIFKGIGNLFNKLFVEPAKAVFEFFKGAFETLGDLAGSAFTIIGDIWNAVVVEPIKFLFSLIEKGFEVLGSIAELSFTAVGKLWENLVLAPVNLIFDVISTIVGFLNDVFVGVLQIIYENIVLKMLDPFKIVFGVLGDIKDTVSSVFDGFKLGDVFTLKFWTKLFIGILNIGKSILGGLIDLIKLPFNMLIGVINSILSKIKFDIKIPKWIPKIGGKSFGIDLGQMQIPMLAKGGIVNKPTLAMIGEDGPEAVVPLNKKNNPNGIGMGNTFNITVNAGGITDRSDKRALAREIGNMIQQEVARSFGGSTHKGRF